VIVWLDARGFIFGWALAYKLKKPFVIIRKAWKLPYDTVSVDYELEYGKNTFELHTDALKSWDRVAIIDDLLATWWTAKAACELVEKLWWKIDSLNFVINLTFLPGNDKLKDYKINSIVEYSE
jgi:adenine phosphoribosyltransferase